MRHDMRIILVCQGYFLKVFFKQIELFSEIKEKWEVFVNSEADTFFAITEPDSTKDLISFMVTPQQLNETVEQFTIDFIPSPPDGPSSTGLRLRWDLTEIVIPFN